MRKWISWVLALALLLPVLPTGAGAAEADLESEIKQQVTAYIASLGTPDASGARNKLTNHALLGKGADLHMEATDIFSVAMLNSNLMRTNLIETMTDAVRHMQMQNVDTLYLAGSMNWYDDKMSFGNYIYPNPVEDMTDTDMEDSDSANQLNLRNSRKDWEFHANACDSAMVDVVGGAITRITLRRTQVTPDTVTCHVALKILDDFDFDGSQSAATQIGSWMTGVLIDTYSWDVTADFSFTVTNPCIHESAVYRWENNGTNLYSASGGELTRNGLETISSYRENGEFRGIYYKLDNTVELLHDRPWTLEIRVEGKDTVPMQEVPSYASRKPFLYKSTGYFWGSESYEETRINPSTGEQLEDSFNRYGCKLESRLYKQMHTYRLENRIDAEGNAAAYLLIDGEEYSAMDSHWNYVTNAETGKHQLSDDISTSDWFAYADFRINYFFNFSNTFKPETTKIEYIQIWENGADNAPHSYFKTTTAAPTCTESGKIVHTCSLCGASYSEATGEAALDHTLETIPGTAATCEGEGVTEGTRCTTCGEIVTAQETIPALGHTPATDAAVSAACTAEGLTEGSHCSTCGTVLAAQEVIPATGHSWNEGELTSRPTVNTSGTFVYTCTACGETKTEEVPYEPHVSRLAGEHRYETAFLTADQMKINLGIEKFDAVVVASGTNFADALSGSYLAAVKDAPILLACDVEWVNDLVKDYIRQNLNEGGTVYILGGEGAIPASFETGLEGFTVTRLAGENRFLTNLLVLQEAGVSDQPILICSGLGFADSLSASATKLPILLVYGNELTAEQTDFVGSLGKNKLYVIGGEGAVSAEMQNTLSYHGATLRIGGKTRFETSTLIAETFFEKPESAVLAYAWDFPDGLCGGPLAATMNAPLILTMEKYEAQAASYIQSNAITNATILGGEKLIPESSSALIFGQ